MKKRLVLIVPIAAGLVMLALNLAGLRDAEWRIYDVFLKLKPTIPEHESVLLLVVDDNTINNINMYPLSRDYMADGLVLLREFNAKYTIFDVEFVDKSPRGIDATYLNDDLPGVFSLKFSELEQNFVGLFHALQDERISMEDAEDYIEELAAYTAADMDFLLGEVRKVERDNDQYLGGAARFFGNTFMTINMLDWRDDTMTDEFREYAQESLSLTNLKVLDDSSLYLAQDIKPTILPVVSGAKGAGFPRVVVDPDGVQRRVDLIYRYEEQYFPQLGLAALIDWLGNPQIEVHKNKIVIKGATHPDKGTIDISIPLTTDNRFLINWPKKLFADSFTQLSYYTLVFHKILESDLYSNLQIMENEGYLSFYEGNFPLLDLYREITSLEREMLAGGDLGMMGDYQDYRTYFFEEVGAFLSGPAEQLIQAEYEQILNSDGITAEEKADIPDLIAYVAEVMAATRQVYEELMKTRDKLTNYLEDKFVIIGYTGTSTTDIGVNPFQEEYMNVGTHASVVNTILEGQFLDDVPWWYSLIIGFAISGTAALMLRELKPVPSLLTGAGFVLVVVLGIYIIFRFTGVYINTLTPSIYVFITFLALSIIKFVGGEKEKSYIRNAFAHYLSNDVINELLSDPDKLNLGGEKKYLTALFTDVRGFSTISEALDPQDLVALLNQYLTEMSDVVLAQRGTIDKYEGDAILCFFGAPVEYEDHAERACYSAVKMKSLELELNKRVLAEGSSPAPLLTRIGINTGDIVVGNMGTLQKMDYTMMGNAVNLAARLEGVNKQYGTWVLISETTYNECGSSYSTRKLDRVRVVGINEPIRLYELVEKTEFIKPDKKEILDIFSEGLSFYEDREWDKAKGRLATILKIDSEDGPSSVYIRRCDKFMETPPASDWDGVFNLSEK